MNDELGSCVPVRNITPAEAVMLGIAFMPVVKDYPLYDIVEIEEVTREPLAEKKRLMAKYGKEKVKAAFPGAVPTLPSSFEEAKAAVMDSVDELAEEGPADPLGAKAAAEKLSSGPPQQQQQRPDNE